MAFLPFNWLDKLSYLLLSLVLIDSLLYLFAFLTVSYSSFKVGDIDKDLSGDEELFNFGFLSVFKGFNLSVERFVFKVVEDFLRSIFLEVLG